MCEAGNKVEEKTQFTGNLALLRVCAIIVIVSGLSKSLDLSWTLLMSEVNDDSLSWVYLPAGLIVAAIGVISLVKKKTLVLKIYAVFMFISMVWSVIAFAPHDLLFTDYPISYIVWKYVSRLVNVNAVLAVSIFLIDAKTRVKEGTCVTKNENTNLGLLRFCATFFLVNGLHGVVDILAAGDFKAFWGMSVLWTFVPIAVGLYTFVKKNSLVLMVYSIVAYVETVWNTILDSHERFINVYYVGSVVIGLFFSAYVVVYVATFFIEPERTKRYMQKAKSMFLFWKNLT